MFKRRACVKFDGVQMVVLNILILSKRNVGIKEITKLIHFFSTFFLHYLKYANGNYFLKILVLSFNYLIKCKNLVLSV